MGELEVYISMGLKKLTAYNCGISASIRKIRELNIQPSKKKKLIEELEKLKK